MQASKIKPDTLFSLMEMDKVFKEHDLNLENFDYVIHVEHMEVLLNKSGQYILDMSFCYNINGTLYHKKYHYNIPKSKSELIDWLMFYLDIYKDEKCKKIFLMDTV